MRPMPSTRRRCPYCHRHRHRRRRRCCRRRHRRRLRRRRRRRRRLRRLRRRCRRRCHCRRLRPRRGSRLCRLSCPRQRRHRHPEEPRDDPDPRLAHSSSVRGAATCSDSSHLLISHRRLGHVAGPATCLAAHNREGGIPASSQGTHLLVDLRKSTTALAQATAACPDLRPSDQGSRTAVPLPVAGPED